MDTHIISITDRAYPPLLKEIHDPPARLFVRGDPELLRQPCIAIVGSRQATSYGKKKAEAFASEIADKEFCVVSGLAYGIDSCAHLAALETGKSMAVIAGGLDVPLQFWQQGIAEKILAGGGAVVSEFPAKMPPLKHHFPMRNRIIAGLAYGVFVVEAAEKSGALITAKAANECGRTVFALPGDVDRTTSLGTLNLIKSGATPVRSAQELLDELTPQLPDLLSQRLNNSLEVKISNMLRKNDLTSSSIATKLAGDFSAVSSTISRMELDGKIRRLPNNKYANI